MIATKKIVFFIITLLVVLTHTHFAHAVNEYDNYSTFKFSAVQNLLICKDLNVNDFDNHACNYSYLNFFENYPRFSELLKADKDFNGEFGNTNFRLKIINKYNDFYDYKLAKNLQENKFYIVEDFFDDSIYGLLTSKQLIIINCNSGFELSKEVCGNQDKIKTSYKIYLDKAENYYRKQLETNPTHDPTISLQLAKIGMHKIGFDNNIMFITNYADYNYFNANAKNSLELQKLCVNSIYAETQCALNANRIINSFSTQIFGDQRDLENLKNKTQIDINYLQMAASDPNISQQLNQTLSETLGKTYLKLGLLFVCKQETCFQKTPVIRELADENFTIASKHLLTAMEFSSMGDNQYDWETEFFNRNKIVERINEAVVPAIMQPIIYSIFVIALIILTIFLINLINKEKSAKNKIKENLDNLFSHAEKNQNKIIMVQLFATIWIGLIFASILFVQVNQSEREVISITNLTTRMNYISEIDQSIKNEVLYRNAWVFSTIGMVFLILSIIFSAINQEFIERIFFGAFIVLALAVTLLILSTRLDFIGMLGFMYFVGILIALMSKPPL